MDASDWLGLEGAVAVVTGASSGIGRAIAVACDVSSNAEVVAARDAVVAKFGRCDVLVNNPAYLSPGGFDTLPMADWQRMLEVNLTGYLRCAQALGAGMLERGSGALLHIASIASSQPQSFSSAHSPSKAAVRMLSRQLAYEWGPRGVRSNTVSPGTVRTPLSERFYADPVLRGAREKMVPMRRIAATSDIADAVLFFASPRASYITGQEVVVDGGLSQGMMGSVPRPG